MKKILIVSNYEFITTNMLVKKMEFAANEKGIEHKIWTVSERDFDDNWEKADVILVEPKIKFLLEAIKNHVNNSIPVKDILPNIYIGVDGEGALDIALDLINSRR